MRALTARTRAALKAGDGPVTIAFSEEELNSFLAFLSRGADRFTARAEIADENLSVATSYRLPLVPFGAFLNARAVLLPFPTRASGSPASPSAACGSPGPSPWASSAKPSTSPSATKRALW